MQHPANCYDEMMTNIRTYMDDKGNSKNGDKGINVMMSLALTETDENEETIIHAAVRHKHREIVKIVLRCCEETIRIYRRFSLDREIARGLFKL